MLSPRGTRRLVDQRICYRNCIIKRLVNKYIEFCYISCIWIISRTLRVITLTFHKKTITELFHPDIVFTKADKGNVALTRTDYNTKVKNLLDNVCTYEVRTNDTTIKIQNKVNKLVKKWENKKLINNLVKGTQNFYRSSFQILWSA